MVMYRPRVIDAVLADRLTSAGAVLIEGPKACGKTFTAEQQAASRNICGVPNIKIGTETIGGAQSVEVFLSALKTLIDELQAV